DTISVSILADRSEAARRFLLSFEGKNRALQQYYLSKARALDDPVQACMNVGMSAVNLGPFQQKMDESFAAQRKFWIAFQKDHKLPDWFIAYETIALNYTDAWLRLYMVWFQTTYQKKKQVI